MAFDQILKRHFWAVILVLTGTAAFLNAQAVTQLIGAGLSVDDKALSAAPQAPRAMATATLATTRATSADPILARNPFDSVTGPLNAVPIETMPGGSPTEVDYLQNPQAAPPCDGVKILVITASSDPDWSFAAMVGGGDNKSILRRRGGDAFGKKVVFVGWDRVWLMNGSQLCQAAMFKSSEPEPPKVAAAPPPTPAASGGAGTVPPEIAKGIVRVSATEFNIDRGVVDKILENQADLMRSARIVPEQENGKTVGIKLYGLRPDTLLGKLGMENGDRLQLINGFEMANPEKALEAYARLRTADKLTVQVNRRGQNMNLDYNIK